MLASGSSSVVASMIDGMIMSLSWICRFVISDTICAVAPSAAASAAAAAGPPGDGDALEL